MDINLYLHYLKSYQERCSSEESLVDVISEGMAALTVYAERKAKADE